MSDLSEADPAMEELQEAYDSGNLIVFAGAGVSAAAGLPDWKRLVELLLAHGRARGRVDAEALADISQLAERKSYIDALTEIKDCLGEPEFCTAIERHLDDRAVSVPGIARAIAALGPKLRAVLTTNLDRLLERALAGEWHPFSLATGDIAQRGKYIFKLHGTLPERHTWVLTRDQYDRALYADANLKTTFTALFHTCYILFVGYGLEDDDFNEILGRVRAIAGNQVPRHFALVAAKSVSRSSRKKLERSGVVLIEYPNADGTHAEVVSMLRALAAAPERQARSGTGADRQTRRAVLECLKHEGIHELAFPENNDRPPGQKSMWVTLGRGHSDIRHVLQLLAIEGMETVATGVSRMFVNRQVDEPDQRLVHAVIGLRPDLSFVVALDAAVLRPTTASALIDFIARIRRRGGVVRIYDVGDEQPAIVEGAEVFPSVRNALEPLLRVPLHNHARDCVKRWTSDREKRFVAGRARLPGGQELPVADAIDQALGSHRCALVLGDFGTGKSTQLARKASTMALAYLEDPQHAPAPVLLPLAGKRPDVAAIVGEHCKDLPVEAFRLAVALGMAVPLFDGLDELILEPHAADGALASLASAFDEDRARFVVTSRKTLFPTKERMHAALAGVRSAAVVDLQELDGAEVVDFVRKATPSEAEADSALRSIAEIHDLESLAQRPALLDLIVRNRNKLSHEGMTAATLYELVAEEWLGSRKAQEQSLQFEQRLTFARSLARRLFTSGEPSASLKQVMHEVIEVLPEGSADIAGHAGREVRTAVFLVFDEKADRFRFAHRSFLEYFLAVDIALRIDAHRPEALDLPRLTSEIVAFLVGIEGWDERCRALRAVLSSRYVRRVSENALLAIYYGARARVGEGEALGEALEKELPAGARLSGANLEGVDVPWIFLAGADLSGASLSEAELCYADLRGARLDRAKAEHAVFNGAALDGARMLEAGLFAASFVDASLEGVWWEGADCEGALILEGRAILKGAKAADHDERSLGAIYQRRHVPESVAWSPDGRWLACGTNDGIRILDAVTGESLVRAGNEWYTLRVVFSPDGRWVASRSHDHCVRLWDARTGSLLRTLEEDQCTIESVAVSPDGRWLAASSASSEDHSVRLWDMRTGSLLLSFEHQSPVYSVTFSPDGRCLVSGSFDGSIRLWDVETASPLRILEGHQGPVHSVTFSPDGRWLASGSDDRSIGLWDADTGSLLRTLEGTQSAVLSVVFSPDGQWLASGSDHDDVRLWDAHTGNLLRSLESYELSVFSVVFSPDGRWLAYSLLHDSVQLWDAHTGFLRRSIKGCEFEVSLVVFSADGRWLASRSSDNCVRFWDPHTGSLLRSVEHEASVCIVISPDGRWLASSSYATNCVLLWDAHTGSLLLSLEGHQSYVCSVVFSTDGRWLASGSFDGSIQLWETDTGSLLRSLEGHQGAVSPVVFSPDGRWLASCSSDRSIRIWDAHTGLPLRSIEGNEVHSLVFSPDSRWLTSASADGFVRLWDAHTGSLLRFLEGHRGAVFSVAFSPDGRWLASASSDDSVRLWDALTGALIHSLDGHQNSVNSVAFSPDGRWIASGSNDHSIRLWNPHSGECLAILYATASGWITLVEGTPFFIAGGDLSDVIRFVSGSRIMPAELWAPLFDRPDIVQAALAGQKPDLAALGLDSFAACALALQTERARRGLIRRRMPSASSPRVPEAHHRKPP